MKTKLGLKLFLLLLYAFAFSLHAQIPTYEAYLINDVQTAPNQYEFDIYVKRIGSVPFEAYGLQCALIFEESIRNGGTLSAMYLQGTSEMNSEQIPSDPSLVYYSGNKCTFRLAARTVHSPGDATIISSVGYGTRLGRFRITTSANKFAPISPNLQWTFDQTTYGYATKFAAYVYNSVIIVDITNQGNHKSQLSNPILLPIANLMYGAKIINNFLTAPNQYEFDIYVKQTDSVQIESYSLQCALLFDEQMSNGGNLSAIYIPGTSEMNSLQIPNDPDFTSVSSGKRIFKLAGRIAPSVGSGTIISSFGNGTRLGRFRITTTAPSLKYLQANITWTFDSLLYGYVTKFESFINDLPMDITIEQFHQNNYIFDNYSYEAKLLNDVQVLPNQYEFDIYLKQTGSIPIEVHNSQCALVFDDTVSSGGILSAIYIPGTSEMNSSQIPGNPDVSSVFGSKRVFKIAGINSTGQGSGTILSSTGNGTRLGRFRIITTARAFARLKANLNWNFDQATYGYSTQLQAYVGNFPLDITAQSQHSNGLTNPVLYPIMDPTYEARLINDVFISNNQYEFDIYAKQTGTIPFKVHSLQCALTFDDSIRNGGNLSVIYIPNTSAMDSSQIPNELDISTLVSGRRVIKIAGRIPLKPESGTLLSSTGNGTRLGRFRISTSSVTFDYRRVNLNWTFDTAMYGYTNKFSAYVDSFHVDVTDITKHLNALVNPIPLSSVVPSYEAILTNDLFIQPNLYEFDIYVKSNGVVPFEVYGLQHCLIFNNAILNGGTPTLTYIPGTSQMNANQEPTNAPNLVSTISGKRVIKMAARIPSGPGHGTLISNIGSGTRFGRFRLSTTAPSFAYDWPDLSWNFNQAAYGYATKYQAYVNGMPQDITAQSSHLNLLGNFPLPLDIVSFTGSATKNFISLEWTTSTELNNKGFEIQRKIVDQQSSINEDDFIKIGFIEGKANSAQNTNYEFKDNVKKIGNYYYRIKQIDYDGSFKYSKEVIVNVTAIANEYILYQNYPNPFNPTTTIEYIIPQSGNVTLSVYDLLGEKVDEVVNEYKESGIYRMDYNANKLTSGVYIYVLKSNGNMLSRKMTVLR